MSKGTALITGASAGIGAALARKFAAMEFDLVITARRQTQLTELAAELGGTIHVNALAADLSDSTGVQQVIDSVSALGVDIDVLVNNAGVAHTRAFNQLSVEEISNLLALNISALTLLTHHFLPPMIQRGSGRILNVASVAAFQPIPSMSVYAASKAFVLSFTEALSEELKGTGVSATALCPGLTKTDMAISFDGIEVPAFVMSNAEDVAREGYDATMAREVIRVPGVTNQAAVILAKHQPRWLVRRLGGLVSRFNPSNR